MFATYNSIKNFPLVYVSLVSNTAPVLTAVLAYFIFGNKLSKIDIAVLGISFIGVTILITGGEKTNTKEIDFSILPLILLILIPLLAASVTLYIRHLKSLSEITIGSILTFSILLIYGPFVYL
jgi:drug/metabolite transporter (DMT)-like permease